MADYIYMMESRLTPEQQRAASLIQEAARAYPMNVYLAGGAVRDMISGFPIRDLDMVVQGNPLKLQKELERHGARILGGDEDLRVLHLMMPGNVRVELSSARAEQYAKPGKPSEISFSTINEDLRRRDFTVNAMALSLNPGSRGLLLDPFNGVADIETQHIRILHNYSFLEEPSRLLRAVRFATRFHWTLEERTQARFNSAIENNYMENISREAVGREIAALAHEEEPLPILRAYDKEGWLRVLHPAWSMSKVDNEGLADAAKTRSALQDVGMSSDPSSLNLYFMTRKLGEKDEAAMQRLIPNKALVEEWRKLEDDAKEFARRLSSREAETPSHAWKMLSSARPELIVFLDVTSRQQAVTGKIRNFLGKWRQVKERLPLPEMAELRITPELPEYPRVMEEAFYLLLDGKLKSQRDIIKFLTPYSPPEPVAPPPPVRRGRAAKKDAAAATPAAAAAPVPKAAAPKAGRKGAQEVAEKVSKRLKKSLEEPMADQEGITSKVARTVGGALGKMAAAVGTVGATAKKATDLVPGMGKKSAGKQAPAKAKGAKKAAPAKATAKKKAPAKGAAKKAAPARAMGRHSGGSRSPKKLGGRAKGKR